MKLKLGNVEREVAGATAIQKYKRMGYKEIEAVKEPEKDSSVTVELKALTMEELKALAKEKGITGASALKKDELLAALKDVNAGE